MKTWRRKTVYDTAPGAGLFDFCDRAAFAGGPLFANVESAKTKDYLAVPFTTRNKGETHKTMKTKLPVEPIKEGDEVEADTRTVNGLVYKIELAKQPENDIVVFIDENLTHYRMRRECLHRSNYLDFFEKETITKHFEFLRRHNK